MVVSREEGGEKVRRGPRELCRDEKCCVGAWSGSPNGVGFIPWLPQMAAILGIFT